MTTDTPQQAIQAVENAINQVQGQLEIVNQHIQQLNLAVQDIKEQLDVHTTLIQKNPCRYDDSQQALLSAQNAIDQFQDRLEIGNQHIEHLNYTRQAIKTRLQLLTLLATTNTNSDMPVNTILATSESQAINQVLHDEVVNTLLPLIKTELQLLPYVSPTLAQSIIDACTAVNLIAYLYTGIDNCAVSAHLDIENLNNILYLDYAKQNPQNDEAINRYEAEMRTLEVEQTLDTFLSHLFGILVTDFPHPNEHEIQLTIDTLRKHPVVIAEDLRGVTGATITIHLQTQP